MLQAGQKLISVFDADVMDMGHGTEAFFHCLGTGFGI